SADDVQRAVRASRAHRCTPIYRRRDDARDALDLGEHPIDERWRAPWRVLDLRWPDPEADQVGRSKAEWRRAKATVALRHQPASDEQDERERGLEDHHRRPSR